MPYQPFFVPNSMDLVVHLSLLETYYTDVAADVLWHHQHQIPV